jgi:hypothetical protein
MRAKGGRRRLLVHEVHPNPIIAAMQLSLAANRPVDDASKANTLTQIVMHIGIVVLASLLVGDREIVRTLKDALKESDHLLRRDREVVIRRKVIKYLPELIESGLDIVEVKKEIERRSNCGKKLPPYRWTRLRKSLLLPPLPTGRPKKGRHKKAKSVS